MAGVTTTAEDCGFKILHCPSGDAVIDIVAVHGMGAHPDRTWGSLRDGAVDLSDPKSWINWLDDESMLPAAFPDARILRYGYQSKWFGEGSVRTRILQIASELIDGLKQQRKDCKRRPIIFVAHSFGGLVILRAVNKAQNGHWTSLFIYDRIAGVVFFGTPFRGAHESLSHAKILELAEAHIAASANVENLRAMQSGDEVLDMLFDDSKESFDMIKTVCFHEQRESDVSSLLGREHKGKQRVVLVDKESGTLSRSSKSYGRDCDHFELNKFSGPKLKDWAFLIRRMRRMQEEYEDSDNEYYSDGPRSNSSRRSKAASSRDDSDTASDSDVSTDSDEDEDEDDEDEEDD